MPYHFIAWNAGHGWTSWHLARATEPGCHTVCGRTIPTTPARSVSDVNRGVACHVCVEMLARAEVTVALQGSC